MLFSLFLNDLTEFISHAYDGLNDISEMSHIILSSDDVEVYFKLYSLLMWTTLSFLLNQKLSYKQHSFLYCKISWESEVNPAKTEVIIFSNRKNRQVPKFMYNGQELNVDDSFVYLGTMFSYNGRFSKNNRRLFNQARKTI